MKMGKMAGGISLLLLGILPVLLYGYASEREQIQSIRETVEQLVTKICQTGVCHYEDYLETAGRLELMTAGELRLEEYQREEEAGGIVHWYLVSWEELKSRLEQEKLLRFREGTAIRVTFSSAGGSGFFWQLLQGAERVSYGGRIF